MTKSNFKRDLMPKKKKKKEILKKKENMIYMICRVNWA